MADAQPGGLNTNGSIQWTRQDDAGKMKDVAGVLPDWSKVKLVELLTRYTR